MNRALFLHTWRANRLRVAIVTVALLAWGTILPVIFNAFGSQFQDLFNSGTLPPQFAQFGGGDIFSLTGAVALGFVHPIAVGLNLVFAVGFPASAVAGGTLLRPAGPARPAASPPRRGSGQAAPACR